MVLILIVVLDHHHVLLVLMLVDSIVEMMRLTGLLMLQEVVCLMLERCNCMVVVVTDGSVNCEAAGHETITSMGACTKALHFQDGLGHLWFQAQRPDNGASRVSRTPLRENETCDCLARVLARVLET